MKYCIIVIGDEDGNIVYTGNLHGSILEKTEVWPIDIQSPTVHKTVATAYCFCYRGTIRQYFKVKKSCKANNLNGSITFSRGWPK